MFFDLRIDIIILVENLKKVLILKSLCLHISEVIKLINLIF